MCELSHEWVNKLQADERRCLLILGCMAVFDLFQCLACVALVHAYISSCLLSPDDFQSRVIVSFLLIGSFCRLMSSVILHLIELILSRFVILCDIISVE